MDNGDLYPLELFNIAKMVHLSRIHMMIYLSKMVMFHS